MGKVKRLSNRELRAAMKRNELEEGLASLGDWVKDRLENVLIGTVVVVVVAVLVPYYFGNQADTQASAATQPMAHAARATATNRRSERQVKRKGSGGRRG